MVDVSVVAGMLVDKFAYHLPLYRQHQRLAMNGITVSRASLTQWVKKASGWTATDLSGAVTAYLAIEDAGDGRDAGQGGPRR